MRKHTMRMLAGLLALALCMTTLTIPAFADPEETETEKPEIVTPVEEEPPVISTTGPSDTVAPETEAPLTEAPTEPVTEATEPETAPVTEPSEPVEATEPTDGSYQEDTPRSRFRFTPDGQLTLIDDFEYVGMDADGNTISKQFLTVETRDGHYFYIIIDRTGDTENVYFLNQVDAADLSAITQIEQTSAENTTPAKQTEPVKETTEPTPSETERQNNEPGSKDPEKEPSKLKAYLSLGAIVLIGVGAVVVLLLRRRKAAKASPKLPEYDDEEDEDDEELETEPDEDDEDEE
ncbi:MAG: DUF4366 domain-containing protein [Oscillospiraceae bacterium]|nr:DUF4366 domain-containing protein [Oscillospiraceae bacterium]